MQKIDALKIAGWLATLVLTIIPATHWEPGTAALVMGVAHSVASFVQSRGK